MYLSRTRLILAATVTLASLTFAMPASAAPGLDDGGDDFHVTGFGHSLSGSCHYYGVASDSGTEAVEYGYATADVTAIGTTIKCWIKLGTATVANSVTQQGLPGSFAATAKQVTIPDGTKVMCAEANTLFLDGTSLAYKKKGC